MKLNYKDTSNSQSSFILTKSVLPKFKLLREVFIKNNNFNSTYADDLHADVLLKGDIH